MEIKAIDHIALTVPNMEEAIDFFKKAFNAKVVLVGLTKEQIPMEGEWYERRLGMPKGAKGIERQVLNIGGRTNIELFCYTGTKQLQPAHTYDLGLQHFAIYVDDLCQAANDVLNAGGKIYESEEYIENIRAGKQPKEGWLYIETPWGTVIEMVNFKEA